jgi:hypothetical protein
MNCGDGYYRYGEVPHVSATYRHDYAGMPVMKAFDEEKNKLKRWFENFKLKYSDWFVTSTEWLVVEEVKWFSTRARKTKTRYVCEIGSDHPGHLPRSVIMDQTAPPAPFLFLAAKTPYVPPPPKTAEDLRREAHYRREEDRYYQRRREQELEERYAFRDLYRTMGRMPSPDHQRYRGEIISEPIWVGIDLAGGKPDMSAMFDRDESKPTPPPRHRRNVG